MSFPNIPDVNASVSLTPEDSANLLLASAAFEELGLAHLINAEAEKLQYVLGTIEGQTKLAEPPTLEELLRVNRSIDQTLREIIKKEMLIEFQVEDALTISTTTTSTTTTTSSNTGTSLNQRSAVDEGNGLPASTPFNQRPPTM